MRGGDGTAEEGGRRSEEKAWGGREGIREAEGVREGEVREEESDGDRREQRGNGEGARRLKQKSK
jgi:hypothetical protein